MRPQHTTQTHNKHHHHDGVAANSSSNVDLTNPCHPRGGRPCVYIFQGHCKLLYLYRPLWLIKFRLPTSNNGSQNGFHCRLWAAITYKLVNKILTINHVACHYFLLIIPLLLAMIMNNDYIDDDKQMYHSRSHFNSHGGVTMQYSWHFPM